MNVDAIKEKAESLLAGGKGQAASILEDGGKLEQLLEQVEAKLENVPKAGSYLAEIPRMVSLLKDHMDKESTETPTKTLVLIVAALLYLVNPKDLIPDYHIGIGQLDDAAVLAACIALTKDDLAAYDAWRDAKKAAQKNAGADAAVEAAVVDVEPAAEAPAEAASEAAEPAVEVAPAPDDTVGE